MRVIKRFLLFTCLALLVGHASRVYGDIKVGVVAAYSFQQTMDEWGR